MVEGTASGRPGGTSADIECLRDRGYVVLPDVLPAGDLDEYRRLAYEVYRGSGKAVGVEPLHSLGYYRHHRRFLDLIDQPRTLDIVRRVLSDNIYVYHTHLDVQPSHSIRSHYWHQDVDIISRDCAGLSEPIFLKVGYYLTDAPREQHGPTRAQPFTHAGKPFDPADPGIPLIVSAGSAVVFDHRLWHTRGINTAGSDRMAIFVAYAYRWIRPRDQIAGLRDPEGDLGETLRLLLDDLPPEH